MEDRDEEDLKKVNVWRRYEHEVRRNQLKLENLLDAKKSYLFISSLQFSV
jgi:hypothetical protein